MPMPIHWRDRSHVSETVTPAHIEKLISEIEKLCRHVAALQRSAELLAGRIIPYEDEDARTRGPGGWDEYASKLMREKALSLPALTDVIRQADHQLKDAELDIGFIRSRIDDAANSVDWKDWLLDQREARARGPK